MRARKLPDPGTREEQSRADWRQPPGAPIVRMNIVQADGQVVAEHVLVDEQRSDSRVGTGWEAPVARHREVHRAVGSSPA